MRYALLLLLVLAQSGCGQKAADWSTWERRSHLGYVFAVPPGYSLELSENEIVFQSGHYRLVNFIEVQIGGKSPTKPNEGSSVEKGTNPAEYVIQDIGSGSGGIEYALSTMKTVKDEQVFIYARLQTEYGPPIFWNAWAVWESLEALK